MKTESAPWQTLQQHADRMDRTTLRALFAGADDRFTALSARQQDLLLDFSKEKLDGAVVAALLELAEASGVAEAKTSLLTGGWRNPTENRAVLHTALRAPSGDRIELDGQDVVPQVLAERSRMLAFAEAVRTGEIRGTRGQPVTDIVNIGIGGSDLGPAMAVRALSPWHDGPAVHFVSNVDGAALGDVLRGLDRAKTLFIVASKSFATQETMMNARSARAWQGDADANFVAVSRNTDATAAFGIPPDRIFPIWSWVGGRYSLWSSIGLPLAIAIGAQDFQDFLSGGHAMDRHFAEAPMARNLPVLMALIGIWRRNFMGCPAAGLMPYDQRLERFVAYVQQLDMESNGKQTTIGGAAVDHATGPLVWGEPGTNAQHSFFQLLHQGSDAIPVDFMVAADPTDGLSGHHDVLVASAFAQSAALAFGRTEDEARAEMRGAGLDADQIEALAPHRKFEGDRPSSTLLYRRLDPAMLGRLIVLFEHKVFVQSVIWGINAFDQWGVELGKALTGSLSPVLHRGDTSAFDASTKGLITHLRGLSD